MRKEQLMPNAEGLDIKFWSELLDNPVGHDKNAEWMSSSMSHNKAVLT